MSARLVNLLAAALVALVVSAAAGSASPGPISSALYVSAVRGGHATPPARHGVSTAAVSAKQLPTASGPSDHDRLVALIKRVDRLQNQLAEARSIALEADAAAGDAQSLTDCIAGGAALIERADGTIVGNDAGALEDDTESFVSATLDDACVEGS